MREFSIGIAGAGLLGRLLAWRLARAGHSVHVFDPAEGPAPCFDGHQAAGFSAAGMLSPLAERETSSSHVAALGWRSITAWRAIVAALDDPPAFAERGSLLLAHRSDAGAAQRVVARLSLSPSGTALPQALTCSQMREFEPSLHGAAHAWWLPNEGQIDPVATMQAMHDEASEAAWHWGQRVLDVTAHVLTFDAVPSQRFDLVFDVRGTGARPTLPVRGVRGEIVWLHAKGHGLTRPVRLMHPRHRVYLVPRPDDIVLVGATEIESEDRSSMSLRSAVELMSAAHSVMPALAEARIVRFDTNLRPALPGNEPRIETCPGLVRINGLFRHGWLIAPALIDDALAACGLEGDSGWSHALQQGAIS